MKNFLLIFTFILFASLNTKAFTLSCSSNCEGWDNPEDLSIEVNLTSCPAGLTEEIEEAFALWNNVSGSKLKIKIGAANNEAITTIVNRANGTSSEAHAPVIACDPNFQTTLGFSAAEADAIPGVSQNDTVNGTRINAGFVLLNSQAGAGANIETKSALTRKIIIAHEVGHMLGLGHSADEPALMFFSIGSKEELRLHQDDEDGMSFFYPSNEPSTAFLGCGLIGLSNLKSAIKKPPNTPPSAPASLLFFLLVPLIALYGARQPSHYKRATIQT